MRLKDEILQLARKAGACARIRELEACDTDEQVINLVYRHFDFCAAHHFPPTSVLVRHSSKLLPHGVCVNSSALLTGREKYAIAGRSACRLEARQYQAPIVYIKDASTLHVDADGHAIALIEAFNHSEVTISTREYARVVVILHGGAKLHIGKIVPDSVKIINKNA